MFILVYNNNNNKIASSVSLLVLLVVLRLIFLPSSSESYDFPLYGLALTFFIHRSLSLFHSRVCLLFEIASFGHILNRFFVFFI